MRQLSLNLRGGSECRCQSTLCRYRYPVHIDLNENLLGRIFGQAESLCSFEKLQFEDYDKVVFSYCNPEERREQRRTVFPADCGKAFALGARLVAHG